MKICKYCKQEFNLKIQVFANHVRWCKKNPKRDEYLLKISKNISNREKALKALKVKKDSGNWNQYCKARNECRPIPPGTQTGKPGTFLGRKHTDATKEKISKAAKKAIVNGKVIKGGRCKHFKYTIKLTGKIININGTWELQFCEWLDSQGIVFNRPRKGFDYIDTKGKERKYYPDFRLPSLGLYVEVKGYETELDRAKWAQFPYTLTIVRGNQIKNLIKLSIKELYKLVYVLVA